MPRAARLVRTVLVLILLVAVAKLPRHLEGRLEPHLALDPVHLEARGAAVLDEAAGGGLRGLWEASKALEAAAAPGALSVRIALVAEAQDRVVLQGAVALTYRCAPSGFGVPMPAARLREALDAWSRGGEGAELLTHLHGARVFVFAGMDRAGMEALLDRAARAFGTPILVPGRTLAPGFHVALPVPVAEAALRGEAGSARLAELLP
jgi:hypothetical protein